MRAGSPFRNIIVITALAGGLGLLAPAALAQAPARPAAPAPAAPAPAASTNQPYKAVTVKVPVAPRDAAFEAFRKELVDIAKRKDRAALTARIVAKDFFWERDFGGGFDPKKPAIDNLSVALSLEDEASAWDVLADFALEPSAAPLPGRAAVVCSPAIPQFDEAARDKLLETSQTDGIEWLYPRSAGLQVRAAPQPNAPVVETLGLHFVHLLEFDDSNSGNADPIRVGWAHVATPSGKSGFVAPGTLISPYSDRLCFTKDAAGAWRIAGYVGGGD